MKKLFTRASICILIIGIGCTIVNVPVSAKSSVTTRSRLMNQENDNLPIKPRYLSDIPFWTKSAPYSTFSYVFKNNGNHIEFKVALKDGKDRLFTVDRYTWKARELQAKIDAIVNYEYSLISSAGGAAISLIAIMVTGGTVTPWAAVKAGLNAGYAYTVLKLLEKEYDETQQFVMNQFGIR